MGGGYVEPLVFATIATVSTCHCSSDQGKPTDTTAGVPGLELRAPQVHIKRVVGHEAVHRRGNRRDQESRRGKSHRASVSDVYNAVPAPAVALK